MLVIPIGKKRNPWKWVAITFICLFLISTAVAIVFAIEASAFRKLFHDTRSVSSRQSEEIRKLNQAIDAQKVQLATEWEFVFDGIQGDVLDSDDFSLRVPLDLRTNLSQTDAYGTIAYIWNYEENTGMLEAPPAASYRIAFSYHDEAPTFLQTDFLSVKETVFLGKNVAMGDVSWFGYPDARSYYFEDTGLYITIQPADKVGRDAAEKLLQNLQWK